MVAGLTGIAGAHAEESGVPDADALVLPPITVEARKRPENIQSVPFAVTAVGQETLDDARIRDTQDLFRSVPNMGINTFNDGRTTYYAIRGIGPLSQPLSPDDSSVVTYIDGVPQPMFGSDLTFLDIERVEVLKGPQGTLFGRNTAAGAINIITRKPSDAPEFSLRAEAGEDWTRLTEAVGSGPLIKDKLAGRLAVKYWGADGYVPNLYGDDRGSYDDYALRGSLVATPTDATKLTLGLFGEKDVQRPTGLVLLQSPDYPALASTDNRLDRQVAGSAFTVTHDAGWATLTSVAGFNRTLVETNTDDDEGLAFSALFGLPVQFFAANTDLSDWTERDTTVNQEIRLNASSGSTVGWVAGMHYFFEDFKARYLNQSAFFAATNGTRDVTLTTNSISAFGEVTVPIVDRLKATGGLRYNHDWKDYDATFSGNGFPGTVTSFHEAGTLTYNYVTGRGSLSYDVAEQSTIYATVARAYKTGGFPRFPNDAALGLATEPYRSATYWTYEVGSKNTFFDGRARLDLSAYFNDAQNEQLYAFDTASFTFRPANVDVRSYGVEAESSVRLLPGLDLTGSVGYTHASLRNVSETLAAATGAANGNRVPNVPRLGGSLALQYRGPAPWLGLPSGIDLLARVEAQYQVARYADVGNQLRLDSYDVVNARIGFNAGRGEAYVFVSNLFDEQYQLGGNHLAPDVDTVLPARGRIVGVGALLRF